MIYLADRPVRYKNKIIGVIRNKKYVKTCTKEHFMIKHNGFGISTKILDRLKELTVNEIEIIYNGVRGKKKYLSRLSNWLNSTKFSEYDGDAQLFLSLNDMENKPIQETQMKLINNATL